MPTWRCPDCPATYGAWLSRCPRCRSTKGLVTVLNECRGCTTAFAVGLARCPHCGSTDFAEQGEDMGKITRLGGPSIAGAQVTGGAWSEGVEPDEQASEPTAAEEVRLAEGEFALKQAAVRATPALGGVLKDAPVVGEGDTVTSERGGEESSPGKSSSASTEKQPTTPEPKPSARPKRARTTANRSPKARTGASSASGTAGSKAADTSAVDGSES